MSEAMQVAPSSLPREGGVSASEEDNWLITFSLKGMKVMSVGNFNIHLNRTLMDFFPNKSMSYGNGWSVCILITGEDEALARFIDELRNIMRIWGGTFDGAQLMHIDTISQFHA